MYLVCEQMVIVTTKPGFLEPCPIHCGWVALDVGLPALVGLARPPFPRSVAKV